ncbi:hypothetical protein ACFL2T_07285 [Elusimicrobiota bacterium]
MNTLETERDRGITWRNIYLHILKSSIDGIAAGVILITCISLAVGAYILLRLAWYIVTTLEAGL